MVYPNPVDTEYTLYTAMGCAQTLNYYITTYDSNQLSLNQLKDETKIKTFALDQSCQFCDL